ncbi:flagellar assembly protein FliW [Haloimpatiens lingqiaonensis]|uniref:flagellar assembly protein FliW n=1 Tax=Haloimpatiens lingqiaonensis TaxID=1380675 RepID=UPI0010FF3BA3|nr:flagellar assembly protein FliW [Haloimpatiens lingqiaonensis]
MQLKTKYHGVREYKEDDIISFNKGICGFGKLNKFIIFPVEENEIFSVLHSIEDGEIGLVVISPFAVEENYEFKLPEETIKRLKINSPEEVLVLTTVTLHSDVTNITTNLRAPIVINIKSKLGEQIILNNEKYLIKQPIFKEADKC